MRTTAAVLVDHNEPLVLAELEVPPLKPGQVLVEISFSGLCHTQILEWHGWRAKDAYLPHCLGHEGSGIVREAGPQVTKVRKDDSVILSWMKGSGKDVSGTQYPWGSRTVNAGAITTLSRYSIISENRLTVLPKRFGLHQAALLGCTAATGLGAMFNTVNVQPHQSVVLFGAGGVGLSALAAAVYSGCSPIIVVDVKEEKLKIASQMGATHCILAINKDPVLEVLQINPGGVEIAIEATGHPVPMQQALSVVRPRGGTAVIIGNAKQGTQVVLDPADFNLGKRLLGTWGGDNVPDRDFVRYLEIMCQKKVKFDLLTSQSYRLQDINRALEDLENGRIVRPLVDMSLA